MQQRSKEKELFRASGIWFNMKITSFNPLIVTKDVASVSALFEALGFERKHNPTGTMAVRRRKL